MKKLGWFLMSGALCSLLLLTPIAGAQTYSDADVKALIETVQALQARVEELEGQQEAAPAATAAPAPELQDRVEKLEERVGEGHVNDLDVFWEEGLHFQTRDDAFKLRIGGRMLWDFAWYDHPKYWELGGSNIAEEDGTEFRQVRIRLDGTIYDDWFYEVEVDFADDEADLKDIYLGVKDIPYVGELRVGQSFEPFGLESMTTSNYITFMERSLVTEAFAPDRTPGVTFLSNFFDNRMTWSGGVYSKWWDEKQHWHGTTRVTGLPWYQEEGRKLLHLGASYSYQKPDADARFYTRPESHQANKHFDTDYFPADRIDMWGVEAALVYGPFSLQSEFMRSDVDVSAPHRDFSIIDLDRFFEHSRHFSGYYVQGSYFLTGEHRPYNTHDGAFGRVRPKHNFTLKERGWGAWELALRYSDLDLNDEDTRSGIVGGLGQDWTVGLNWYTTPNTRIMLNYVHSDVENRAYEGNLDVYQGRVQIDF